MQHQFSQQPQHGTGFNSKVAIPRLDRRENDYSSLTPKKHRVMKACTNCRKRKVKCTGELPRCKNCEGSAATCVYEQARKDRLMIATKQNRMLISLLKDLSLRVTDEDKQKIDAALEAVEDDIGAPTLSTIKTQKRARKQSRSDGESGDTNSPEEARAPASVGSNEDMDLLDENLLRSRQSRETGFVGQNSEVQWLRSLQRQMGTTEDEPYGLPYGPPGTSNEAETKRISAMRERRKTAKLENIQHVADSSFYLDSESLKVDVLLDLYELPPPDLAERLFNCYIETVHGWFPIIQGTFEDQFCRYIESAKRQQPYHIPQKWRAHLNLIFAIGAQYSHLTNAPWQGDSRDHLIYMTRAVRILGLKDITMIISAPNLQLIQATGLMSFYYLAIGHVSRAWVTIGISLRFALAVGLHLRNEDPSASPSSKENLVRVWWSLHSLECLLSSITGRPCIIANEDCAVPLPSLLPEEQVSHSASRRVSFTHLDYMRHPTTSTSTSTSSPMSETFNRIGSRTVAGPFLDAHIKIGLTTRKVLKNLYSAHTASVSWERIQSLITSLLAELDQWATAALPDGGGSTNPNTDSKSDREKLLLEFHYHSIKILITRPCLCRLERRIQGQSDGSVHFNQRMAETCVQAAQKLTLLLPDRPDPMYIYSKGPWWSIVHNIMQAMAVFLLEMLYRGTHETEWDHNSIPKCIKKLLCWLRVMRHNNPVAERAYKLVVNILKSGEYRVQAEISDLFAEDEIDDDNSHLFPGYPGTVPNPQQSLSPNSAFPAEGQWQTDIFDPGAGGSMAMPNPYFLPEQFHMLSTYANPFLTTFDQGNPIRFEELFSYDTGGSGGFEQNEQNG